MVTNIVMRFTILNLAHMVKLKQNLILMIQRLIIKCDTSIKVKLSILKLILMLVLTKFGMTINKIIIIVF